MAKKLTEKKSKPKTPKVKKKLTKAEHDKRFVHPQYTVEDFKGAIEGCQGKKTLAIQRLGCSSRTFYHWLEEHPELKDLIKAERTSYEDRMFDLGNSVLMKGLLQENQQTARFVVDRYHKIREGYGQVGGIAIDAPRHEINISIVTDDTLITDPTD